VTPAPPEPAALEGFGAAARRAVAVAEDQARELGHDFVGTEHLLLGLLAGRGSGAHRALDDAGASVLAARHKVEEAVGGASVGGPVGDDPLPLTARAGRAIERAARFAHQRRAERVATRHLLLGVLNVEGRAGQVLRRLAVDIERLTEALEDADELRYDDDGADGRAGEAAVTATGVTAGGRRRSSGPTCPSCGAGLEHGLSWTPVLARDKGHHGREGRELVVAVVWCPACGTVVGLLPD
jgi:ATP-dependent Clp protease ATP-binding subunit ClpC